MHLRLLVAASLLALSTQAGATSFVVTTDWLSDATGSTSDATSSSTDDDEKIVRAAKDDAASFVASQGQIRGVHLEAAVTLIRGKQPQLQASDMQLAEAILAY
ncbi:DUF2388 domain-containing protein [Pseudomonas sp. N040]|uniref:DUF2388 domain-containing protein n=1 Tax=Pseudomonas sp. N040 TaxID=2785325 RepID=UPI0018A26B2E|nr:DUF2388 domain-containing protein [Pseudomonas sp. N040]MBF7728979.1 DUF2388 domain-containing protein [Pseudomonas sp. N040]MBW7012619.1 DUF2388 domain-containing protein [Pseudomonas sp. N040]